MTVAAARTRTVAVALAAALGAAVAAHEPSAHAEAALVPGEWVAFTAPRVHGVAAADARVVVFVPDRKPETDERIPPAPASVPELRCGGAWQLITLRPKKLGARGAWGASPSGDGRWVWHPKHGASATSVVPPAMPDAAADYGDEFFFCANAPGEAPWTKVAHGKTLPGSWVTLVDAHRTTTLFVANTYSAEGDAIPDLPQKTRRIRCSSKQQPIAPSTARSVGGAARPRAPFGRWVPDPFGSRRWAWVPSAEMPFGLRPSASPPGEPEPVAHACSWFDDAD